MEQFNSYCLNIYTVVKYLNDQQSENKNIIITDTLKCAVIGAALAALLRSVKGKCHYSRYAIWMSRGAFFGLAYSFYFTSQKV